MLAGIEYRRVPRGPGRLERNLEPEAAAARLQVLVSDAAPHGFHQAARDGGAQAGAALAAGQACIGLLEGLEQAVADGFGNADAGVADHEAQGDDLSLARADDRHP